MLLSLDQGAESVLKCWSPRDAGAPRPQPARLSGVSGRGGATFASATTQPKYNHPTRANGGNRTAPDHAAKAKKLGIAMPRSTAMA